VEPPTWARRELPLGIAHHQTDEPWANSTRRTVLLDLADGPEDWVCDAALNAMVAIARVDPQVRHDVAVAVANQVALWSRASVATSQSGCSGDGRVCRLLR
jgi:hypothetical protein